jgi:drug/metabolite transporter (DMT)-like permease
MSTNLKAALVMIGAMVMLTFNDAIVKHTGQTLSVGQILLFRGLMVMTIFAVAIRFSKLPLLTRQLGERWTLVRGVFEVSATACFLSGLVLLPLAVASALVFASPLFITLVAGGLLGERVGWRRWLAVLMGFGGTLLITEPWGASWSVALLLPIAAAALVAGRDISTRYISPHQSSLYVAFLTATMVTIGGAVMSLFQWREVTPTSIGWVAVCAVLLSGAYFALITAFRSGELSFIAPLKYVSIIVAIGLGALIWDERLSLLQFAGVGLVIAAGVVIFYRGRKAREGQATT